MKSSKSHLTTYSYENDNIFLFEYRTLSVVSYLPPPRAYTCHRGTYFCWKLNFQESSTWQQDANF